MVTDRASRFPVIDDDRAEVVGIMLAKDLLQYCGDNAPRFKMRDIVRSAVFVPEQAPQRAAARVPRQPQPWPS